MVVYADILIAVNFAVDYLILKGASAFCGKRTKPFRLILSAALGAASSLALFFNTRSGTVVFLYRVITSLAVSAAAFCPCGAKMFSKCCFAVLLQSFILSGVMMLWQMTADPAGVLCYGGAVYFDIGIPALMICSVLGYATACLLSRLLERRLYIEQTCEVTLINQGAAAVFTALIDTGNSLVEPFSGEPVIVCESKALGCTVPGEIAKYDLNNPTQQKARLIPYKTIDSSGLLPAFIPEKMIIKTSEGKAYSADSCYVAVTETRLAEQYSAICNPMVITNNQKVGDAVYENKG